MNPRATNPTVTWLLFRSSICPIWLDRPLGIPDSGSLTRGLPESPAAPRPTFALTLEYPIGTVISRLTIGRSSASSPTRLGTPVGLGVIRSTGMVTAGGWWVFHVKHSPND